MVNDIEKEDLEISPRKSQDVAGLTQNSEPLSSKNRGSKGRETERDSVHTASSGDTIAPVEADGVELPQKSKSRTSSIRSRPLVVVARSKRRGLLGRLTIIPEVENPYDYTRKTKWLITLIVALAAAAAPLGSSIFYRTSPKLPQSTVVKLTCTF